ncbi:hypothetical protein EDB86DRAFT_2829816 [Lactarius hatsudake]|nr:hypothetical protein EDB86DRAFT_2829816 [Lactarius hatsudake]
MDMNAAYEDTVHVLSTKLPKEEKEEDATTMQEDYDRDFRTNVLLTWVLLNLCVTIFCALLCNLRVTLNTFSVMSFSWILNYFHFVNRKLPLRLQPTKHIGVSEQHPDQPSFWTVTSMTSSSSTECVSPACRDNHFNLMGDIFDLFHVSATTAPFAIRHTPARLSISGKVSATQQDIGTFTMSIQQTIRWAAPNTTLNIRGAIPQLTLPNCRFTNAFRSKLKI